MQHKFFNVIYWYLIFFGFGALAKEVQEPQLESRAFQLSFITPSGTNGWESWNSNNKFSLNILAGYAGGVHGAEFSGLGSILRTDYGERLGPGK